MGKRIAIWAYFANNLGDDLFIQMLCLRYPTVQFYIQLLPVSNKTFLTLENLHILNTTEDNGATAYNSDHYEEFDAVVMIGGSIFTQYKAPSDYKYKHFSSAKKLFVIGANFGPYTDRWFLDRYRRWFEKIDDICFRDSASVGYFPELKTIRWAPDVVFGYPVKVEEKMRKPGYVLISLIDCNCLRRPQRVKQCADTYENGLAAICLEFAHRGYGVKLVPFCINEDDMLAAQRVMDRCLAQESIDVRISPYTGDIPATLTEIAEAEYIVATRFHAMILGWKYGKPTYPIIYNRKQLSVIRDMDYQGAYCNIEAIEPTRASEIADTLIGSGGFCCNRAVERAQEQFLALDRFLKQ